MRLETEVQNLYSSEDLRGRLAVLLPLENVTGNLNKSLEATVVMKLYSMLSLCGVLMPALLSVQTPSSPCGSSGRVSKLFQYASLSSNSVEKQRIVPCMREYINYSLGLRELNFMIQAD